MPSTTEVEFKKHSAAFSSHDVLAILEGRKTQFCFPIDFSRAKIDGRPVRCDDAGYTTVTDKGVVIVPWTQERLKEIGCPFGEVGDRLWVKETWGFDFTDEWKEQQGRGAPDRLKEIVYASGQKFPIRVDELYAGFADIRWRPAAQMRQTASRMVLEIASIKRMRLQETSEEDAMAQGVSQDEFGFWKNYIDPEEDAASRLKSARDSFRSKWDSEYIKLGYEWRSDPWIFTVAFSLLPLLKEYLPSR